MLTNGESHVYDVVIDCIIGVGILVNVYLVLDQMTDGQLSRSMSVRLTNLRAKIKESWHVHGEFERQRPYVVFEAMSVVEDADNG